MCSCTCCICHVVDFFGAACVSFDVALLLSNMKEVLRKKFASVCFHVCVCVIADCCIVWGQSSFQIHQRSNHRICRSCTNPVVFLVQWERGQGSSAQSKSGLRRKSSCVHPKALQHHQSFLWFHSGGGGCSHSCVVVTSCLQAYNFDTNPNNAYNGKKFVMKMSTQGCLHLLCLDNMLSLTLSLTPLFRQLLWGPFVLADEQEPPHSEKISRVWSLPLTPSKP